MQERTLDPYAVLGVGRGATRTEIAQAHRRLAKRFHPDLHAGDGAAERMRRINQAWRILSNPARRARYDATRRSPTGVPAGPHWSAGGAAAWTTRQPFATAVPRTRRPPRREPAEPSLGDRPWVTAVVVAALVLLFFVGTFLGSLPQ